jgi:Fe-S cluster assembly protein SufD
VRLVDLPSRRVEAWKYSDLVRAVDERVQFVLRRDRSSPEVKAAPGGIIGALATQAGEVEVLHVPKGVEIVRVDRPRFANLAPRLIDAHVEGWLTRVVIQEGIEAGVVLDAAAIRLGPAASFRQFVIAEGAKLARIETHVEVEGEGAEVELNGVYLCAEGRHADLTSIVTHRAPNAKTYQLIKGVACKGGRGVFQGKIVVERTAQRTDARQHHHGMLLEDGAEVFAKPELMIHADDVACAHGNTAGGLDEKALFYLRARGVPEVEARALLTEAFFLEALPDWAPPDVRAEIEGRIGAWLRGSA